VTASRRDTLIGLAVLAASVACHHAQEEVVETSAVVEVEVAPAQVGTVSTVVSATGSVQPAPGADMTVTAPQAGRIVALPFAVGERVHRGQVVARFDLPPARQDLATRNGELAQARARLENARHNHERLSGLLERGIASRKEVEDAKRELAEAEAAVRQGEGTRAAAADFAAQGTVTAPFEAVVGERWHNPGDLVDVNEHVLRLVDPRRLQVVAAVAAADVPRIVAGRPARVRTPSGTDVVGGVVSSGAGAVDPMSGTAPVRIAVRSPLPPGTPVEVEITADERPGVLTVPGQAIEHDGDEAYLYVVGAEGKAQRRPVRLGMQGRDTVEIVSGVTAGERVIVRGQHELPDGARVTIAKRDGG
jgi:RND family efflux transporter MFP subunit